MALTGAMRSASLRKDTGAVGERIPNGRSKLPKNMAEGFSKLLVDDHVLVNPKVF